MKFLSDEQVKELLPAETSEVQALAVRGDVLGVEPRLRLRLQSGEGIDHARPVGGVGQRLRATLQQREIFLGNRIFKIQGNARECLGGEVDKLE